MKTSENGKNLIKGFEGCRLTPYRLAGEKLYGEKLYTVGFGHYGITSPAPITQAQADKYFNEDILKFENYVNKYVATYKLNQNEFDALVSFTYNCGAGCLATLLKNRTKSEVADALLLYCKDSRGVILQGLKTRRQKERELFLSPVKSSIKYTEKTTLGKVVDDILAGKFGNNEDRKTAVFDTIQTLVNERLKNGKK